MRIKPMYGTFSLLFFIIFLLYNQNLCYAQDAPSTTGYSCNPSQFYPCQTYVFYRARGPEFLDLASIGDLFSISRLMIANPSNISTPNTTLVNDQSLLVPITCSCNNINTTFGNISYAGLNYSFNSGDTMYMISTVKFQNLTTFQSAEVVNPTVVPENIDIGQAIEFPIFCKCPNRTQTQPQNQNQPRYLISYVFQPFDNISSIASRFGTTPQSIREINGNNPKIFDTLFIPLSKLPNITQPTASNGPPPVTNTTVVQENDKKGTVIGLAIGLGISGLLLILLAGLWGYREKSGKSKREKYSDVERQKSLYLGSKKESLNKEVEVNLMADVSDCLDKYKMYKIEQLWEATDGFDEGCLIQGSVYKGIIDGEVFAIKKMKWNAREELKILQKVNHGNLVKLEGFCIDPKEANCYLVYEYVENGSLHSWLHKDKKEKLSWKTRLKIATDVANGLLYIHEHTRPRVVHKDIKSSNILLDSNMRAKVANFGLAKSGCNAITMHIVGTQGYIAPEYLTDGIVSTKMDVFSFGVVLLELMSGREAIDDEGKVLWAKVGEILEGSEERKVKKLQEWMDDSLLREECTMESVMNVMSVAISCLNKDPSKRPSMVEIVYALSKSIDLFSDISEEGLSPRQVTSR
ncbi:serine/threonine receptor-like kinase NFP [Nicotiana tomentosiformis]|uniref:serine/threonine receptor-like kinase NFP n=1 Tax=Nicotiana tomentosiformis TaxID=4098 RepID=UPI00051B3E8C|nr:serine/threonine receptor-like kinase NFP [Nicotiana tomentosiformis]